ncbi:MAG: cytidine deaminase, partial [Acidimicrobiia bacterium]
MNTDELAVAAREAAEGSYSPYSHFRVGAVVVSAAGEIFTGANIENAAYPVSSCAESTAINTAVSSGVRKIASIAVAC